MDRRGFLLGAGLAGAAGVLAACTPPATPTAPPAPSSSSPSAAPGEPVPPSTTPPPPPPLAWGPTQAQVDDAIATAAAMTPEQVAGQVIVARYATARASAAVALVQAYALAGVILFDENVAGLDSVRETAAQVEAAHAALGRDWPAVVSVDNEGGRVQRLAGARGPWTTFPSFSHAGAAPAQVVTDAMRGMGTELRASGMTVNWAPDADVTVGPGDAAIGDRSASRDPQVVAASVVHALAGFREAGLLAGVKHFPGHGALTTDSHQGLPVQQASTADLEARDLIPFRAAVQAGAPYVMVGHIDVLAWQNGIPASLSPNAYAYLREQVGFTGVAVTDGLDMGALKAFGDSGAIAVLALAAGADLLLSPADTQVAHRGVVEALGTGALSRDRVNEAAGRVIAMMRRQAELATAAGPVDASAVGSAKAAAAALAAS